jgi:hypothetical protein
MFFIPTSIALRRNPALKHSVGLLVVRDISNRTNERGVIAAIIPPHITDYTVRVFQMESTAQKQLLLLGVLNSFVFDYLARQRIGGTHVSNYILEQTPCPPPADFSPDDAEFVSSRTLELTCTAFDLRDYARACGRNADPFVWDEDRRLFLRCELDAFFFHMYGLSAADATYVMETFPLVQQREVQRFGEYRTRRLVLEAFERLAPELRNRHQPASTPVEGDGSRDISERKLEPV